MCLELPRPLEDSSRRRDCVRSTAWSPQFPDTTRQFPELCFAASSAPPTLCGQLGRTPTDPTIEATPGHAPIHRGLRRGGQNLGRPSSSSAVTGGASWVYFIPTPTALANKLVFVEEISHRFVTVPEKSTFLMCWRLKHERALSQMSKAPTAE